MQSNSFNSISAGAQTSIKAFFHDFCNFMAKNYSATTDQLMLDWNCVGATARYHGHTRIFEFRLWERSGGHLGIPDMTVIVYVFHIDRGVHDAQSEADAITLWLHATAKANGLARSGLASAARSATSPTRATAPRTHRIRYPDAKSLV